MHRIALLAVIALLGALGVSTAAVAAPAPGGISGTLLTSSGTPASNVFVSFRAMKGGESAGSMPTDANGHFESGPLAPGSYWVSTNSSGDDARTFFSDAYGPIPVPVTSGFVTTGVDFSRQLGGRISGKMLFDSSVSAGAIGTYPAGVTALRFDPVTGFAEQQSAELNATAADGSFLMSALPPGDYTLRFGDSSGLNRVVTEYLGEQPWLNQATVVTVTAGATTTVAEVTLSSGVHAASSTTRLDGLNRFEAAAAFTQAEIETGDPLPVVYIVNGLNFPDALGAGPAAAYQGGALLLVEPTLIPESTRAELERLAPDRIEIVGGAGSVSEAVKAQLNLIAPTTRIGGSDRFAASRAVAREVWGDTGAREAFIATGYNYPDALSAGSIASIHGSPVILVDSAPGFDPDPLDAATVQLLIDLGVETVHIVGGPGSVGYGIEQSLIAMPSLGQVDRFGGANRYEASSFLAASFPQADMRFVATGENFPDALAGSWLAGRYGGAIVLVPGSCIPASAARQLAAVELVIILGGPASVTPAVANRTVC